MGKKLVTLRFKYDDEWEEYCVEYLVNGVKDEEKSYYTDDKQDAKDTMKAMKLEIKQ